MNEAKPELLRGTLDMLILKIVALGPSHGYAIAQRLRQISKEFFQVHQGSLYPALHRLEDNQNGENLKPAAKPSSTRSPGRAASKWRPRSSFGSASVTPLAESCAQKRSPSDASHSSSPSEISLGGRARSRTPLPCRSPNCRLCSRRTQPRRSPPPRKTRIWRPRPRQRRSPRHPLGNSPRQSLPRFPLRHPQSSQRPPLHLYRYPCSRPRYWRFDRRLQRGL